MITIVSGLPRSGTSMMMQMLKAGGIEVLTDDIRQADENNQRGYFEYEKVKKMNNDNAWLAKADGKVVKIVSQFLQFLPADYHYKIIFMERNLDEVLGSQEKMLENLGTKDQGGKSDILKLAFTKHLEKVKEWLGHQEHIKTLYVSHKKVITSPHKEAQSIANFLDCDLNPEQMSGIVDKSLYRQRIK